MDYSSFYKERFRFGDPWPAGWACDAFVSAYNNTARVKDVFARVNAGKKLWAIHGEYGLTTPEIPEGRVVAPGRVDEAEFMLRLFEEGGIDPSRELVCIDITGFLRPHIIVALRVLQEKGATRALFLYSEPELYVNRERTSFSGLDITAVRPIRGFGGSHDLASAAPDLLVLGVGYEAELVKQVAYSRRAARKVTVFGFPPLQAEFFQENVVRASVSSQAVGDDAEVLFAPANDPFVTAGVLSSAISAERHSQKASNVYLSPLSTKPHALGFGLYYLFECRESPTSIVYPFSESYSPGASTGVSRVWLYDVELPSLAL